MKSVWYSSLQSQICPHRLRRNPKHDNINKMNLVWLVHSTYTVTRQDTLTIKFWLTSAITLIKVWLLFEYTGRRLTSGTPGTAIMHHWVPCPLIYYYYKCIPLNVTAIGLLGLPVKLWSVPQTLNVQFLSVADIFMLEQVTDVLVVIREQLPQSEVIRYCTLVTR